MVAIRRALRLWATAWLVFQAVTLSAWVSAECCESHRAARQKTAACHRQVVSTYCPMRAADGTKCPMHRTSGDEASRESQQACAMRGSCSGPVAALAALLSNAGVLPGTIHVDADLQSQTAAEPSPQQLVTRLAPPDSPPPRA